MVDKKLAGIARIVLAMAAWMAAGCIAGCGGYDIGPDPLPWTPPEETARSGGK